MPSGRRIVLQLLLLVALACSAYLAFLSLTGGQAVGCGPDSDCDRVLASRWSRWIGIPVSLLALVTDGIFLVASFRLRPEIPAPIQRRAWAVVFPSALLVAGAAVWFSILQISVLHSICPYCMTAHACGLIASLIAIFSAPMRATSVKPWELDSIVFMAPATVRKCFLGATLGLVGLISGQVLHQPQSFVVQKMPEPLGSTNRPTDRPGGVAAASASTNPPATNSPGASSPREASPVLPAAAQRLFPVYQGRFQLDLQDLPTLGSPTNAQVMVALHDFTCHHCRVMHPVLLEAQHTFSNQLVIVTLPMPFDPTCNPLMQRPNPKHTNACAYAQLSLAVWRADRSKHHAYDDFLFAGEQPPPVPEARQAAIQLVGVEALDKALNDPWVDQHVRLGISLYEVAYRAGQGSMPQFIVGQSVAVGTLPQANFMQLLAQNLGLSIQPPAPLLPTPPTQ